MLVGAPYPGGTETRSSRLVAEFYRAYGIDGVDAEKVSYYRLVDESF